MPSKKLHATIHATIHPKSGVIRIDAHRGVRQASGGIQPPSPAPVAHLLCMSNHTIAAPITTWAALRTADREVLNRAEVAALLAIDPRTVDQAITDGTIPAVRVGRRILIPRRPFMAAFGVPEGETA
jgi:excisionase family DNA binding protein